LTLVSDDVDDEEGISEAEAELGVADVEAAAIEDAVPAAESSTPTVGFA